MANSESSDSVCQKIFQIVFKKEGVSFSDTSKSEDDPEVQRFLKFMREHLRKSISLDQKIMANEDDLKNLKITSFNKKKIKKTENMCPSNSPKKDLTHCFNARKHNFSFYTEKQINPTFTQKKLFSRIVKNAHIDCARFRRAGISERLISKYSFLVNEYRKSLREINEFQSHMLRDLCRRKWYYEKSLIFGRNQRIESRKKNTSIKEGFGNPFKRVKRD